MSLKVIGAGFGRTGTLSLKKALEILGFDPCYHMFEVGQNPDHPKMWWQVSEGTAPNWHAMFADYQACVDWPACAYYYELYQAFPGSKVVLSKRDPEKWYRSAKETIYPMSHSFPAWARTLFKRLKYFHGLVENIIWQGTFSGRFLDEEHAIQVFDQHLVDVRQKIPAEHLLEFEAVDGWAPLCDFLGVEIPDEPFPYENDSAAMKRYIRRIRAVFTAVHLAGAAAVAGLIYLAVR